MSDTTPRLARRDFRVLTRTRGGYGDGVMYDVQLQAVASGGIAWAQTFTDAEQAEDFRAEVEDDLDMDTDAFRRKHNVSGSV